jgi:hypothetical protein
MNNRHLLAEEASYKAICVCYLINLTQQTIHQTFCLLPSVQRDGSCKSGLFRKLFINGRSAKIFQIIPRHLVHLLAMRILIANSAHSSVCGLFI